MANITDMTKQPGIHIYEGKEYKYAPLTLLDWGKVVSFIQRSIKAEGIALAEECKTDAMQNKIIERYEKKAKKVDINNFDVMASIDSIVNLILISFQHHNPDITKKLLADMFVADNNLPQKIIDLSTPEEDKKGNSKKKSSGN